MTELLWAAVIAATPPTVVALLTGRSNGAKIGEVHKLANNRLTEALDKINELTLVIERQRASANKKKRSLNPRRAS